jgi:hypothetical protein
MSLRPSEINALQTYQQIHKNLSEDLPSPEMLTSSEAVRRACKLVRRICRLSAELLEGQMDLIEQEDEKLAESRIELMLVGANPN